MKCLLQARSNRIALTNQYCCYTRVLVAIHILWYATGKDFTQLLRHTPGPVKSAVGTETALEPQKHAVKPEVRRRDLWRHSLSGPLPPSYCKWAPHLFSPPEGLWCWPGWFQNLKLPPSWPENFPLCHPEELPTPLESWGMLSDTIKKDSTLRQGCMEKMFECIINLN